MMKLTFLILLVMLAVLNSAFGFQVSHIVSGDFNNDNKPDLAITASGSPISVLLNNGHGEYNKQRIHSSDSSTVGMVTGYFNDDQNLDIISARVGITVMLGNGDGSFVTDAVINTSVRYCLATADLNADGRMDIVTDELAVLLMGEGGIFQEKATYSVKGGEPQCPLLVDLNGDGKKDLVSVLMKILPRGAKEAVSIRLGKGGGAFEGPKIYRFSGYSPSGARAADLNHDGLIDLIIPDRTTNEVLLLFGDKELKFDERERIKLPKRNKLTALAIGRLDGDETMDFVVGSGHSVLVMVGNGDGTFENFRQFTFARNEEKTGYASDVLVEDVNSNGHSDVVVYNRRLHYVSVLFGNGKGTFQRAKRYELVEK